jgi:hypothetical protein
VGCEQIEEGSIDVEGFLSLVTQFLPNRGKEERWIRRGNNGIIVKRDKNAMPRRKF